jgi:hypothetical protein
VVDRHEIRRRRVELLATILLATAAVAIAWSTYQATQWRGEQAADNSKASAARIESSAASIRAGQLTQVDIATFTEWVDAYVAGNTELADFYRHRFRDEFKPAFDAWIATNPRANPDAPATPFVMSEYRVAEADEAARLNGVADDHAEAAGSANEHSDTYMLVVVLFASSLFFAGMSTKLRSVRQQEVLVVLGAVIFVVAAVLLATFPAMFVT